MNDFFQNMLKQTSTTIANLNDNIRDFNKNLSGTASTNSATQSNNANVETMDLSPSGLLNTFSKFINPSAAKTFLQGSGVNEANHAFSSILTGDATRAAEGVRGLLKAFNTLELPFPIITNGATVSTKNTFTDAEIDAMANAVGNGIASYGTSVNSFVNTLYNNVDANGIAGAWQTANSLAGEGIKSAFSAGQIAHINAYDGAAGSDQEIARAQAIAAGGQAASENFDATGIANAYGNAIGKTVDGVVGGVTGATNAAMNSVDLQATKDSLVSGLDAGWAGGGTALAKNANLRENSVNNFLNAWGFNANGTWNGNIDPVTAIPQSLLAIRDIAQTYDYIPQIAYDSTVKSIVNVGQNMIANKNAQYGETTEVKHYTSLGDSVESGLGLSDYYAKFVNGESIGSPLVANTVVDGSAPDLVADALGAEAHQYHMPGARTSELLYMLDPDEYGWAMDPITPLGLDPMQGLESGLSSGQYSPDTLRELSPQVREDLAKSEVISLDVGWNDWWSMCYEGGIFRSTVQYALILKELYEINPNAEIVLVGGYNPFEGWDLIPGMDDNIISYAMQGIFDVGLNAQKMVTCMLYPGKCTYADTRDTEIIQGRTGFFGVTLDDMGYNPHPTEEGAKHQANNILYALGKEKVYDEPDKGDYYKGQEQFQSADLGVFGLLNGIPSEYNYLQKGIEGAANALRPNTVNTAPATRNSGMLSTLGVSVPGANQTTGTMGVVNAIGEQIQDMMTLSGGNGVNSHSSMVSNMAAVRGVQDGDMIGTAVSSVGSFATTVLPGLLGGATEGLGSFLKGLIPGL